MTNTTTPAPSGAGRPAAVDGPKPDPRLDLAERVLSRAGFAATAASLAAYAAHALGWLPAALEPFRIPMLAMVVVAFTLADAFPAMQRMLPGARMRWTRVAFSLSILGLVLYLAGIEAGAWTEDAMPVLGRGMAVLLGAGLLIDLPAALRNGSLPPLGIAATVAGLLGVLLLVAPIVENPFTSLAMSVALFAFATIAYGRLHSKAPARAGEGTTPAAGER